MSTADLDPTAAREDYDRTEARWLAAHADVARLHPQLVTEHAAARAALTPAHRTRHGDPR